MKTFKHIAMASLVALLGFSQTGFAAGPQVDGTSATRIQLRSDLRCKIEGFYDANATQPIANGASVVNLDQMWVRFTVINAGSLAAKGFNNQADVDMDGQSKYSKAQVLDLPAGFSASYPLVKVDTYHNSTVKATLSVDSGKSITETSELNNVCTFQVKSSKLH